MLMERAGTGGALFRNFYRDFLMESAIILEDKNIMKTHHDFKDIAKKWTEISELFNQIGETGDEKYLNQAGALLKIISENEKSSMQNLYDACK